MPQEQRPDRPSQLLPDVHAGEHSHASCTSASVVAESVLAQRRPSRDTRRPSKEVRRLSKEARRPSKEARQPAEETLVVGSEANGASSASNGVSSANAGFPRQLPSPIEMHSPELENYGGIAAGSAGYERALPREALPSSRGLATEAQGMYRSQRMRRTASEELAYGSSGHGAVQLATEGVAQACHGAVESRDYIPSRNQEIQPRTEAEMRASGIIASHSRNKKKPKGDASKTEQAPTEASGQILAMADLEAEDCPICLSALLGNCAKTQCGHMFHLECLETHLKVSTADQPACPLCRAEMRIPIPVTAASASGREIEVLQRVPPADSRCHFDRAYTFLSLGEFAGNPKMLYVRTSNDDRKTSSREVMWMLATLSSAVVYLNFRSNSHVTETGACRWLEKEGWSLCEMEGTISSGFPSGIYQGPVFSKQFPAGEIHLKGSNCWEGTYFVFVEVQGESVATGLPWQVVTVSA